MLPIYEKQKLVLRRIDDEQTIWHQVADVENRQIWELLGNLLSGEEIAQSLFIKDIEGENALCKAARYGNVELCKYFVNFLPAELKVQDSILGPKVEWCQVESTISREDKSKENSDKLAKELLNQQKENYRSESIKFQVRDNQDRETNNIEERNDLEVHLFDNLSEIGRQITNDETATLYSFGTPDLDTN